MIPKGEFLSASRKRAAKTDAGEAKVPASKRVAKNAAIPVVNKSAKKAAKGQGDEAKRKKAAPREVPLRPTHKLRLRALANRIKAELLGKEHDPARCQAKEVEAAAIRVTWGDADTSSRPAPLLVDSPVVDKRTFQSWWRGSVKRVWSSKLEACDRVVGGSSLWMENSCLGEPLQRHFDALDVRCDDRIPKKLNSKRGEQWLAARMDLMDKCLQAADRCWSVFSYRAVPGEQALALMAQVAPGTEIPVPTLTYAPPAMSVDPGVWLGSKDLNPYQYEAPDAARVLHNASAKFGLMRFLLSLGVARASSKPWWYDGWVFDLASVAAMGHFFAVFGPAGSPESNVGEDLDLIAAVSRIFYDHDDGTITPLVTDLPGIAKRVGLPPRQLIRTLMGARRDYYAMLGGLGISFRDVYAFAKPVEVMGAKTIEQNMLWRGQPPEGWHS